MTTVPQEIYDEIIDHLHENKTDLATCALVCRAWIPSSRHHLFRVVRITIDEKDWSGAQSTDIEPHRRCVVRFLDLITFSEYILPFIREVRVCFEGQGLSVETRCLTIALTILRDAAPRYRSISILYWHYHPLKLHEVLPLHRLTRVSFKFSYNRQDVALCASMPCLQELQIFTISPRHPYGDVIEEKILLSQLRSLDFNDMEILRTLAPPPLLRDLTFGVSQDTDMLRVGLFLQPLVSNIERLFLASSRGSISDKSMQELGLYRMTHLRSLTIHHHSTIHQDSELVPVVLQNVTSCEVDRVEFSFHCEGSFTGNHWVGVPAILERPNFRRLCKLEFLLDGSRDIVKETEAWILQQLQGLEARHILHITHALIYE